MPCINTFLLKNDMENFICTKWTHFRGLLKIEFQKSNSRSSAFANKQT